MSDKTFYYRFAWVCILLMVILSWPACWLINAFSSGWQAFPTALTIAFIYYCLFLGYSISREKAIEAAGKEAQG